MTQHPKATLTAINTALAYLCTTMLSPVLPIPAESSTPHRNPKRKRGNSLRPRLRSGLRVGVDRERYSWKCQIRTALGSNEEVDSCQVVIASRRRSPRDISDLSF